MANQKKDKSVEHVLKAVRAAGKQAPTEPVFASRVPAARTIPGIAWPESPTERLARETARLADEMAAQRAVRDVSKPTTITEERDRGVGDAGSAKVKQPKQRQEDIKRASEWFKPWLRRQKGRVPMKTCYAECRKRGFMLTPTAFKEKVFRPLAPDEWKKGGGPPEIDLVD